MKKLFLSLGLVVLVGAGCLNLGGRLGEVEGDWYLAFDLPQGWVMVDDYQDTLDRQMRLDFDVGADDNEIILQNFDKPIIINSGVAPSEDIPEDSYVIGEGIRIKVTRIDPRRLIPEEAEDLGEGFFKEKLCEDNEDCRIGGRYNYIYYLELDENKYRFDIHSADDDLIDEAENIILSAKPVTQMTSEEE